MDEDHKFEDWNAINLKHKKIHMQMDQKGKIEMNKKKIDKWSNCYLKLVKRLKL